MQGLIYELDVASKQRILDHFKFKGMMNTVIGHITLWIKTSDQLQLSEMSTNFTDAPDIRLVGLCADENVVVGLISVNGDTDRHITFKGRYHITVAVNYGVLPTYSRRLLEYSNFDIQIPPIPLSGEIKLIK